MNGLLRHGLRLSILLLAVRVLMDLATPHWPGAFRLDPTESVEAATAQTQSVAPAQPVQPRPSPHVVAKLAVRPGSRPRPVVDIRVVAFRPAHNSDPLSPPPASDDD